MDEMSHGAIGVSGLGVYMWHLHLHGKAYRHTSFMITGDPPVTLR